MSFGNSWASCHTIDKDNKRDMPNSYHGMYSSGTISYMLDQVSIVFYTVTAAYNGNEYYFEDKINRCMFHYGKDKLIQGRVYPQDNDSNENGIYKDIREIMQKIIADCEGTTNYWTTKKGVQEIGDYVNHGGTNYPDYRHYNNCCISFPKEKEINPTVMVIGHKPICVECGSEHWEEESINCCNTGCECESCGEHISDDDSYWVDGSRYCRDCVTYCEHCEEYVLPNNASWVDSVDAYICDNCIENNFVCCSRCGEYYPEDETSPLDHYEETVCDDCLSMYYTQCDECGDYFRRSDIIHDDVTQQNYCEDCYDSFEDEEAAE